MLFINRQTKSLNNDRFNLKDNVIRVKVGNRSLAHLYFATKDNLFLTAEERILTKPKDPEEYGQVIIENLIKGPQNGLMSTIPKNTALRAFYIIQDGTAYVDLGIKIKEEHPGGIESELLTIYSIVNSLILNISKIDSVKILIQGHESLTLAGHIDLSFPFTANMLLIR